MIAVLKKGTTPEQTLQFIEMLKGMNLDVHMTQGQEVSLLAIVGDTSRVDMELIASMHIVDSVKRVTEPFSRVSRKFQNTDSIITVAPGVEIGGGHFAMIAGPCSVESESQIIQVAAAVKQAGAQILRGGAFKPRTSPYAFQGLGNDGLKLLQAAKEATGLPVCSELMNLTQLDLFEDVDLIQIGARNMQNFDLLKEVGRTKKPILLKRGIASTLQELLMSAEYIMSEGNPNVILCERGIRTYETYTRNTLDLSSVPVLHSLSHLPVVVDPSHGTGKASLVPPMALAAAATGADGIMVEVHNDPACALCDGAQALTPAEFERLNRKVHLVREAIR